jgi:AAA15 family ATPase/GTPase
MPIEKVSIKNFTVFRDFEMELCKGVNLIIGENGIGKTHLLKVIYSLIKLQQQCTENNETERLCVSDDVLNNCLSSVFDIDSKYFKEKVNCSDLFLNDDATSTVSPKQTVFIPAKEMLSHAKGLVSMKNKYGDNMPFDSTLLDIIEKAQAWSKVDPIE